MPAMGGLIALAAGYGLCLWVMRVNRVATVPSWPVALGGPVCMEGEKAPAMTRAFPKLRLVKLTGDTSEHGVQVGAEAVHNGDDGNGDAGRDQTIFNCRAPDSSFTKREMRVFIS